MRYTMQASISLSWHSIISIASIKELDLAPRGSPVPFLTALLKGQTVCFIYPTGLLHVVAGYLSSPQIALWLVPGVDPRLGSLYIRCLSSPQWWIARRWTRTARLFTQSLCGSRPTRPGLRAGPSPARLRLRSGTKAQSPLNNANLIADIFMK